MKRSTTYREMWCNDCKEIVSALVYYDSSTGYRWTECPNDEVHDLDEVSICTCGEPKGKTKEMCPSCLEGVREAWNQFIDHLPVGMDTTDAVNYVVDNWL